MKIKNFFRTILAVMAAAAMSLTVIVFAACDPADTNVPEPTPETEPDTHIEQETIETILASEYAAIELTGKAKVRAGAVEGTSDISGIINLDGNADISFVQTMNNTPYNYAYAFMRDWKVYSVYSASEVTQDNIEDAYISGLVDIQLGLETILEEYGEYDFELPEGFGLDALLKCGIDGFNGSILRIANAAGAVSEENGVVTVNVNKILYNVVRDAKNFVNSLNGETTIGDVLGNETIKSYAQIATELVTPEELVTVVAAILENLAGGDVSDETTDYEYPEYSDESAEYTAFVTMALTVIGEAFENVEPDENSTTYDYLVKVIDSQELVDAINASFTDMGLPAVLTHKVSEFTLDEVFTMAEAGMTVSEYVTLFNNNYNLYASGIKLNSYSVTVDGITPYVLSNTKIRYTYDSTGLISQTLEANIVLNMYEANESGSAVKVGETAVGLQLTFAYKDTEYTAADFMALPAELPEIDNDFSGDIISPPTVYPPTEGGDDDYDNGDDNNDDVPPSTGDSGDIISVAGHRATYIDSSLVYDSEEIELSDDEIASLLNYAEATFSGQSMYFTSEGVYGNSADNEWVYEQTGEVVRVASSVENLKNGTDVETFFIDGNQLLAIIDISAELNYSAEVQLIVIFVID